jgi:hypothetical protein
MYRPNGTFMSSTELKAENKRLDRLLSNLCKVSLRLTDMRQTPPGPSPLVGTKEHDKYVRICAQIQEVLHNLPREFDDVLETYDVDIAGIEWKPIN